MTIMSIFFNKPEKGITGGSIEDFFNRFENLSDIKNYREILFNMYLVEKEARPAFLLELANYSNSNEESIKILNNLKSVYTEFKYTHEIQNHRVFIHKKPLISSDFNDDVNIAKNLGFLCHGIPDEKENRIRISFTLHTNNDVYNFYTEICRKENYDEKHFNVKKQIFNNHAKNIGHVEMEIKNINPPDYLLNKLINNTLTEGYENDVINHLNGNGLVNIGQYINQDIISFKDLLKEKKTLLFFLLWVKHDPFNHLYPLSNDDAKILDNELYNSFYPINLIQKYDIFDKNSKFLNNIDQDQLDLYETKKNHFINVYTRILDEYKL
jgi:hypothetical protein